MDKQGLKKQRIRAYFLESAKEIITKEGVENISVRKVADMAGYSYATIYNYFADIHELLWAVKIIMINDLVEFIQKKMNQSTYNIEGIKKLFKIYIEYFIKNPNVFKFFYFHPLPAPNPDYGYLLKKIIYHSL